MALLTRASRGRMRIVSHAGLWCMVTRTLFGHHKCIDRELFTVEQCTSRYFPINAYCMISGFFRILNLANLSNGNQLFDRMMGSV